MANERGRSVQVADGNRQSIGGVGGLGRLSEIEKARDHVLDLLLLGFAITDDGGFDGEGSVFGDFESGGRGGEHRDAAHLTKFECRLHVERIENVFDRDLFGVMVENQSFKCDVDAIQAKRQSFFGRKLYGTAAEAGEFSGGSKFDDAVSGVFGAAVDAEDPHGGSVPWAGDAA